jgi:hypothetical protein
MMMTTMKISKEINSATVHLRGSVCAAKGNA